MKASTRVALVLSGIVASSFGAAAQTPQDDVSTKRQILRALSQIENARCGQAPCAKATREERADPPLGTAEGALVIRRAIISATAEHCGLDWQRRNFLPMMAHLRAQNGTERQMALAGLLHGIVQGEVGAGLAKRPCNDHVRKQSETDLDFKA